MSVTLVWRTDAHNSDEPPQSRTDDWTATVLDKLTQVGELARGVGAQGVLDGGDLFHIKSPSRNSHELVQQVAAVHRGYPCPTWATVGNHDVKHGSLEYLGESPLGVLFKSGALNPLYEPQHEAVFEEDQVNPRQWEGGGPVVKPLKVRVVAVPYHGTSYDRNRLTTITKKDEDYLVVIAHLLASDKPGEFFFKEDVIQYREIMNLDPDLWLFGHWHKDQGVKVLGGKTFVNIGSLTRGALTQDEIVRIPKAAVLRFDRKGVHVEEVPLNCRPSAEVFDIAGKARAEERDSTMEVFVDNLQRTLSRKDEKSLLDEVRGADAPDEIRERALHYLERAGAR